MPLLLTFLMLPLLLKHMGMWLLPALSKLRIMQKSWI